MMVRHTHSMALLSGQPMLANFGEFLNIDLKCLQLLASLMPSPYFGCS